MSHTIIHPHNRGRIAWIRFVLNLKHNLNSIKPRLRHKCNDASFHSGRVPDRKAINKRRRESFEQRHDMKGKRGAIKLK